MLSYLPPQVLIEALSYISHSSQRLASYSQLCRSAREMLIEDSAWRHLCSKYWHATEERIQDFPSLTGKGLYHALERWMPIEGFYVLAPAFPWGLLVLVRITQGRVIAEVIRFVPDSSGGFTEFSVPLFSIDFSEPRPGVVSSSISAPWLGGMPATVEDLKSSKLRAYTAEWYRYFDSTEVSMGARRALRVARCLDDGAAVASAAPAEVASSFPVGANAEEHEHDSARHSTRSNEESEALSEEEASDEDSEAFSESSEDLRMDEHQLGPLWSPGSPLRSAESAKEQTEKMLKDMFSVDKKNCCDLALIRGPEDFVPEDPTFPGIRPGLYVGDYGHDMYGQFRTEVLLLEYITLGAEAGPDALESVFRRPRGEPMPREMEALRESSKEFTFVRGVKQCGDFHVPASETTFVAVCGPASACEGLSQGKAAPQVVRNRQTGGQEIVVRSWRGFGTLAMPGFRNPSWDGGWLVQLESAGGAVSGSHRFAFVWFRNQDAVVLKWIETQDQSPFLQRAWLPEDLR